MFAVQVVVAIGIVLATVLVAGGRGDGLSSADAGRRLVAPPADRPLVAADLDDVRLGVAFRGYRMDEVDEILDRASVELAERDARIAELERSRAVTAAGVAGTYGARSFVDHRSDAPASVGASSPAAAPVPLSDPSALRVDAGASSAAADGDPLGSRADG